ncbi:MAG: DUF4190 domain-containing protein [Actinobacteria bacterium]|nr:DUF4190 domain-containing protein [Actinomycetota bacterium]MBW3647181.1 DUF4190 domain-containing protein [Actinomycetota bacterium]
MSAYGGQDKPSSTRTGRDDRAPSGTTDGADSTGRIVGPDHPDYREEAGDDYEDRRRVLPAKTSAAAAFALVFGLAALFCALTAILSPAAVVFAVIGIILGIVGMKMAKRPGVTGKGVAIGGLVTAVLGLLLGGAVLAGAAALVNDERRLDQLQQQIDKLRESAPGTGELREQLPS